MYNILICDDEKDIVNALKIYLHDENYRLFEAFDGAEALAVIEKNEIHLVLMDIMMPLFSVYITFFVPAAMGVYWIFKSLVGIVKQWILKKAMPLPEFTEEDYKAAEKELSGKNKNKHEKKERDPNAPRVRSLHHIDDEDYDEKGNYIEPPKEPEVKAEDTPVEAAPLKLDEDKKDRKKKKGETLETSAEKTESESNND